MATFLLYPAEPHFRRADGLNAIVVPAADAASAPAAARALCKRVEIDAFDNFAVVEIGATTAFAVEGHPPVSQPGNAEGLPHLGRGGHEVMVPV